MNKKIIFVLIVFVISQLCIFSEENKWTVAAEKFTYSRGQNKSTITDATSESLPVEILEKLGQSLNRVILPDEKLERLRYDLRKERISLFLQLSNAYKKRDAVFLNNYSPRELKSKLADEEKSIDAIQTKIDNNLKQLSDAEKSAEELLDKARKAGADSQLEKDEFRKIQNLFKKMITTDEDLFTVEKINFYKNDINSLYSITEKNKALSYSSYEVESEMVSASIDTLLTGVLTSYGEYTAVTVTAIAYPGGKIIGSVTEIGSLQETDLITSSIARQLIPIITNSMPVVATFEINPGNSQTRLYIDDIIQNTTNDKMILDSGVHNIQVVCEGYETISTDYYFSGNEKYEIKINMIPKNEGFIKIGLAKPIFGDIYSNGLASNPIDDRKSLIKINGKAIIGEFIAENGKTDFYYVSEKLNKDGMQLIVNPKPLDRSEYIDKSRKWMYGAYSSMIVSVIPLFYTMGNFKNWKTYCEVNDCKYCDEAYMWQKYYQISMAATCITGSFFLVELVRYFVAANSVLPKKATVALKRQNYIFENSFISTPPQEESEELDEESEPAEENMVEPNQFEDIQDENQIEKIDSEALKQSLEDFESAFMGE